MSKKDKELIDKFWTSSQEDINKMSINDRLKIMEYLDSKITIE